MKHKKSNTIIIGVVLAVIVLAILVFVNRSTDVLLVPEGTGNVVGGTCDLAQFAGMPDLIITACTDSDQASGAPESPSYAIKGKTTFSAPPTFSNLALEDSCSSDGKILYELTCSATTCQMEKRITCANVLAGSICYQGKCTTTVPSCTDSDGAGVTASTVQAYGYTEIYSSGIFTKTYDNCVDSGTIKEYYCSSSGSQFSQVSCASLIGAGATCSNGRCVPSCSNECSTGQTGCSGSSSKWTCGQNDQDPCLDKVYTPCDTGSVCSNGACVSTAPSCTDTDGGVIRLTKGTVSGKLTSGATYSFTDACISASTLREYSCSGTSSVLTNIVCNSANSAVCSNGACVTENCADSDNGINFKIKGTVTSTLFGTRVDTCDNLVTGGMNITEYYCDQGLYFGTKSQHCNNCVDGTCLD